jgi:spore germination protein KA
MDGLPQVVYTERSDKFCANILEGRVGILIDGIPIAYILPVDFSAFFQAPEDYALHYIPGSYFRLMRCVNSFASMILPALYVSVTTFHQEMIPTDLAISIIQSKEGVPFPTFIEVVLMLLAFEVLLEAGLRLPKSIGQSVSIIGALVVGDVAITAKILSPGVVIVIAVSGITGFVIPSQDMANANRICRLFLFSVRLPAVLWNEHRAYSAYLSSVHAGGLRSALFVAVCGQRKETIFSDTIIRFPWVSKKQASEY